MSLEPRNRNEQEKIANTSKRYFISNGWEIDHLTKGYGHFIVKKGLLKIFVSCHDSEIRKFYPSFAIADALSEKAYGIKYSRHIPTIFVFASHFSGILPDTIAHQGLYIFVPDELSLLISLEIVHDQFPSDLTARQIAVLSEQTSLCLSIIERFRKIADLRSALDWAERAVKGAGRYTQAHDKLFELLVEAGKLQAAADLGHAVLKTEMNNLFFLRSMQKISSKIETGCSSADWEKRIESMKKEVASSANKTESLDSILRRQRSVTSEGYQPTDPAMPNTNSRGIRSLAKRIFLRSS